MKRSFILLVASWFAITFCGNIFAEETSLGEMKSNQGAMTLTVDTPWVVSAEEPEAIERALADVKRDWYKVIGRVPVVLTSPPKNWTGPVIYLGRKGDWWSALGVKIPAGPESFVLKVLQDAAGRQALVATGNDLRGAIYAAYALSEEILGVDPWYFWVDKEPRYRGKIELPAGFAKQFGPPTFRYRGWFINDEDLLRTYSPDPLKENVFSPEIMDRIFETLLRLRGNMVVPGTFNFPDERCHELAARRGLVINMHHILVVGLNTYRWPSGVPFSYSKHPEVMEKYWRTCIDSFKDKEIVWTVGYRGKHDRPFWADEPEIATPEARGAIITKAIAKQVELIRAVQPHAPIIANLWVEGANLYHDGHLKLPEGVIVVWPDDGTGIIRDQGKVQAGQGIYYHTAMLSGQSNQLSEMVPPGRIASELGRFVKAGAAEYFLVNVSDVRPVPLSTDFAMKFAWNAAPFVAREDLQNHKEFIADWCRRQFGAEAAPRVAEIFEGYFDIPYHRRDVRWGDNAFHSLIRQINVKAAPLIAKDQPLTEAILKSVKEGADYAAKSRESLSALAEKADALAASIPSRRRSFYRGNVIAPLQVHRQSLAMLDSYTQAIDAYAAGDKNKAAEEIDNALEAGEKLAAALRRAEYGKWAAWYQGEDFVGLDSTYDRLRCLKASLSGEPVPPIRANEGYPALYEYQKRFEKNFPLMYPPKP
ncbi:MAG: glycosyl hydrolase 115 family protein [Pirellulales bacterium]|nr:glycosyl hydrolase 115 family protein [Pirellulales bacterium]